MIQPGKLRETTGDVVGFSRKSYTAELVIDGVRQLVTFTRRQVQGRQLRADGKTTQQASSILGISYHTAKHHLERAFERAGNMPAEQLISHLTAAGVIIQQQRSPRSVSTGGANHDVMSDTSTHPAPARRGGRRGWLPLVEGKATMLPGFLRVALRNSVRCEEGNRVAGY